MPPVYEFSEFLIDKLGVTDVGAVDVYLTSARTLTRLGFNKVFNLQGGLNGWIKDNMPVVKTGGRGAGK